VQTESGAFRFSPTLGCILLIEGCTMFMAPGLALFFIAFKLGAGCVIGLFAALVCYRSRRSIGLLLRGTVFGGIAFVIASGVAGWAVSTPLEKSPFRRLKNPHPGMLPKADQREAREWPWQSSEAPFLS
jgi:hypothetical protein